MNKYGHRLYDELKRSGVKYNLLSYGLNSADVMAQDISIGIAGIKFNLVYQNQILPIHAPKILGKFNLYNLLALTSTLIGLGVSLQKISEILASLDPVNGRMEKVAKPGYPLVVIDYAHTPDALNNVLQAVHGLEGVNKVFCVFGCGGNRDREKRPLMGEVVFNNSDFAIVTSDNPRNEDPLEIIQAILKVDTKKNYEVIEDRRAAIKRAFELAGVNDVILIAGKGHEIYQEIKGIKHHFSDYEEVQLIMNKTIEE